MKKLLNSVIRPPCTIDIQLNPSETIQQEIQQSNNNTTNNKFNKINNNNKLTIQLQDPNDQFGNENILQTLYRYDRSDPISGKVILKVEKPFDHQGITIELIGEIVSYVDSRQVSTFLSLSKDLCGNMQNVTHDMEYQFSFQQIEKEWDSYRGINIDLRYYLKVTIQRSMGKINSIEKEQEIWIQKRTPKPTGNDTGIGMEVGLEGIVLLSIKYDNIYHSLKTGCILGELQFFLVNVKIDKAEVSIIRKETLINNNTILGNTNNINLNEEQEVLGKFEVIDGTPAKDEIVPVRIYLNAIPEWKLTSTCENCNQKFSIKYFIHLALCDVKGRRFFKQKEIILYRDQL
ncbi:hypothetical protein ABK040_007606 [Willaertia magna]